MGTPSCTMKAHAVVFLFMMMAEVISANCPAAGAVSPPCAVEDCCLKNSLSDVTRYAACYNAGVCTAGAAPGTGRQSCYQAVTAAPAHGLISLQKLAPTLIFPTAGYSVDASGTYTFGFGDALVGEQAEYDKVGRHVYSVKNYLGIVDVHDPAARKIVYFGPLESESTDVAVCGDYFALSMEGIPRSRGYVLVYQTLAKSNTTSPVLVNNVTVGYLPDHVMFTRDCKTIITANEAEAGINPATGQFDNPEGSISILKWLTEDLSATPQVRELDFTGFNSQAATLVSQGVRHVYKGQNSPDPATLGTFSRDMEPEYMVLSKDEKTLFVGLQEANAIAKVDMDTMTITSITPLGFKEWSSYSLDASDRDGPSINLQAWPIKGMYLPDQLAHFTVGGVEYVAIANEGDTKDYSPVWNEEERGISLNGTVPKLCGALGQQLKCLLATPHLGRIKISITDGIVTGDASCSVDGVYTFGGRSFSILRASDLSFVYDSGDELERRHLELFPPNTVFHNSEPSGSYTAATNTRAYFDTRSDDKGIEPESLAVGVINGRTILFVGSERASTVLVYDVSRPNATVFQSGVRVAGNGPGTLGELFAANTLGTHDPESIEFVPAADSPTGENLLFVSGARTGTLEIFRVDVTACVDSDAGDGPDDGCGGTQPFCYNGGCFAKRIINPSCSFNADQNSTSEAATCITDMAAQVFTEIELQHCFATELDLDGLVHETAEFLQQNGSYCNIEVLIQPGNTTTRRLLQSPSSVFVAVHVYVNNAVHGAQVLASLQSAGYQNLLAEYFGDNAGDVQAVDIFNGVVLAFSSATSDPHFITSRGQKFDFQGEAERTYCIVKDRTLQVNARFTNAANALSQPASTPSKPDDRTWMDQVGILVGNDHILVGAESPPGVSYANSFGTLHVNGVSFRFFSFTRIWLLSFW
eukprot:jgi/Mesvir1/20537/Mv17964-RA.3